MSVVRGILLVGLVTLSIDVWSQLPSGGAPQRSEKDFSFVPIPYVSYNRSLEFMYGALPMAMYNLSKKDTISPSSISGLLLMGTTNKTWFGMGFSKFYFKEDHYRVTVAGGVGNINFQFFPDLPGAPEFVEYNTAADFFMIEGQRKVAKGMYAGLRYVFINLATEFDVEGVPVDYTTLNGLGLVYAFDRRDDVYYPRKGDITNFVYNFFPGFLGNDVSSNKIELDYNRFIGIKNDRDVLAFRFYAGVGIGDLDFNQQFIVGGTDLRGYSQGEFRGDQLYAVQGEYRWNITSKFGLAGFAGLATVFQAINEDDNGQVLPAVGGGFRVTAFPKNKMNVGIDGAVGKGDWSIDFRIGEAF